MINEKKELQITNDEGRIMNYEGRGGECKIYRGVCKTPLHNIVQR